MTKQELIEKYKDMLQGNKNVIHYLLDERDRYDRKQKKDLDKENEILEQIIADLEKLD